MFFIRLFISILFPSRLKGQLTKEKAGERVGFLEGEAMLEVWGGSKTERESKDEVTQDHPPERRTRRDEKDNAFLSVVDKKGLALCRYEAACPTFPQSRQRPGS